MLKFATPGMTSQLEQQIEQLFRENYAMLYRTAYSLLDNAADAEDVPQTIFLRLLRSGLPPYLQRNPKGYLYRAAVNLSLDVIRTRRRQRLADGPDYREIAIDTPGSADSMESQQRVAGMLAELHPEAAHILILRYLHDYSEADIARLLGISRGSVAMRLFRARAHIKKLQRNSIGVKS
jgi:RNA polymerase sigma-70 factor, ECF subfamily